MSEVLRSLAIASALLLPVVILSIIASIAAVRRGEALAHPLEPAHEGASTEAEALAGQKSWLSFMPERDPNVLEILIMAVVLFTLTMGLLFGFSILQNLM